MITVKSIICPKCKSKIYSRARHDAHTCRCGLIFIDGGFDYMKFGFTKMSRCYRVENIKMKKIRLNTTKEKLYEDWNLKIDDYGVIDEYNCNK